MHCTDLSLTLPLAWRSSDWYLLLPKEANSFDRHGRPVRFRGSALNISEIATLLSGTARAVSSLPLSATIPS
ncbi:hypothetical protein MPLSOD_50110 [Mesorhizobium sp. SOD10]|nr:hypothetical protein MPLSOD_50110 [Mesorhizobium sp. SOD10]